MKLGKTGKVLLGLATAWPIIYICIFFCFFFAVFWMDRGGPPIGFKLIFVLHFLTMLWMVGLIACYLVYLFKTDRVAQDKKALWAVVLLLGNIGAMPVFWYLYIWRETEESLEETHTEYSP